MPEEPDRGFVTHVWRARWRFRTRPRWMLRQAQSQLEHLLLDLSNSVTDRYFLQGANATPTKKLGGLA